MDTRTAIVARFLAFSGIQRSARRFMLDTINKSFANKLSTGWRSHFHILEGFVH